MNVPPSQSLRPERLISDDLNVSLSKYSNWLLFIWKCLMIRSEVFFLAGMLCKVELTGAYGKSLVGKTSLRLDALSFLFNYVQSAYLVFKSPLHFTFMNITHLWDSK